MNKLMKIGINVLSRRSWPFLAALLVPICVAHRISGADSNPSRGFGRAISRYKVHCLGRNGFDAVGGDAVNLGCCLSQTDVERERA